MSYGHGVLSLHSKHLLAEIDALEPEKWTEEIARQRYKRHCHLGGALKFCEDRCCYRMSLLLAADQTSSNIIFGYCGLCFFLPFLGFDLFRLKGLPSARRRPPPPPAARRLARERERAARHRSFRHAHTSPAHAIALSHKHLPRRCIQRIKQLLRRAGLLFGVIVAIFMLPLTGVVVRTSAISCCARVVVGRMAWPSRDAQCCCFAGGLPHARVRRRTVLPVLRAYLTSHHLRVPTGAVRSDGIAHLSVAAGGDPQPARRAAPCAARC